ncbi:MAG: alpha/beta hydrolase [Rhodothermales bacterium]|nr:alpha/beta hydrolase [Rhodothermales bacterium]
MTEQSVQYSFNPRFQTLAIHQSGTESHANLPDERIRTIIGFAPWGRNFGFFDASTLQGIQVPMLLISGSDDDVSGYQNGTRAIWEEAVNVDRALLTLENANHNAGGPYPAPAESFAYNSRLGFSPEEHYGDAVWDTARMNHISQHFSTAWLDLYLKGDSEQADYLDQIPYSNDGVYSIDDNGNPTVEHTNWKGLPNRTAKRLHFE